MPVRFSSAEVSCHQPSGTRSVSSWLLFLDLANSEQTLKHTVRWWDVVAVGLKANPHCPPRYALRLQRRGLEVYRALVDSAVGAVPLCVALTAHCFRAWEPY